MTGFTKRFTGKFSVKNGFGTDAVEYIDKHTGMFNDFYINFDRILLSENSFMVWRPFKGGSLSEGC